MLNFAFSSTQVLLGGAMLVALLLGTAFAGRYYFRNRIIDQNAAASRTKYAAVDVFQFQPTLMRLGLICSLAFTFLAFNWTQFEARDLPEMAVVEDWEDIENAPPITRHEPPPPPPPPVFMASDDLIVDTVTFRSGDAKASDIIVPSIPKARPKPNVIPPPPPIVVDKNPVFKVVEKMPLYGDCGSEADAILRKQCSDRAIMTFIGGEVRYPALARENGVHGTAVISFVVEKDGSLSDIQVLRDPGTGLGAEAERVIQLMAQKGKRWEPGEQRGRKVRVQFNIPIKFKLD